MAKIYEVRVSDGTRFYFVRKAEAEFYHNDTAKAGFGVRTQEFDVPATPEKFVAFMERIEAEMRPLRDAIHNCELFCKQ